MAFTMGEYCIDIYCPATYKKEQDKIDTIKALVQKRTKKFELEFVGTGRHDYAFHILFWVTKCNESPYGYKNGKEKETWFNKLKQDIRAQMISWGRKLRRGRDDEWEDAPQFHVADYDWHVPRWFKTPEEKAEAKALKANKPDIVGKIFIDIEYGRAVLPIREENGWYRCYEAWGAEEDFENCLIVERYPRKDVAKWLSEGRWKERDLSFLVQKGPPDVILREAILADIKLKLKALDILAPGRVKVDL